MKRENRRKYQKPDIEIIKLDNEISMVMQSLVPPPDPGMGNVQENNNNNPYKIEKV
jgi:hypothetical protein